MTKSKSINDTDSVSSPPPRVSVCSGPLMAHATRFPPGADLSGSLRFAAQIAAQHGKSSALSVVSVVGSLSRVVLRMANAQSNDAIPPLRTWLEPVEIVSLCGTLSVIDDQTVRFHLHMSISDASGEVFGGHLVDGTVHTTVELVLGSIHSVRFQRLPDEHTGFDELVISNTS